MSAGRDRETLTSEVTMKFCLDSDNCCAFIHKTPKSGIREDRPPLVRCGDSRGARAIAADGNGCAEQE